jgi:hypothetical protein
VKIDEDFTYLLEQATQFFSLFSEVGNEEKAEREEMAQVAGNSGTPRPLVAHGSRHSILKPLRSELVGALEGPG